MGQDLKAYLIRLKPYFVISVAIFAVGAILGIAAVMFHAGLAAQIERSVFGFVGVFRGLSKPQLAVAIFANNAVKSLAAILLGVLVGFLPVIFLLINGAALGAVIYLSVGTRGLWRSAMAILPHGILELPAVLLATSAGLLLGGLALKRLAGGHDVQLGNELRLALGVFMRLILPVLLIAAFVEAYLTALVATP